MLGVVNIVFGKEGVDELRAHLGSNLSMFPQKVTNEGQTRLQELETVPLDDIKLGVLDMAFIDGIKTRVQLTEIIDS